MKQKISECLPTDVGAIEEVGCNEVIHSLIGVLAGLLESLAFADHTQHATAVGVKGEHKLFVLEEDITENTKIFNTARKAGEYVDKHFGDNDMRCNYDNVRIVDL